MCLSFFNCECDIALSQNKNLTNFIREVDNILLFGGAGGAVRGAVEDVQTAPKKLAFCLPGQKLRYAGFLLSSQGAEMCDERAEKLWTYPEPTNRKELAAWLGLAAQCSQWFPEINVGSREMRIFLKKYVPFLWTQELTEEFQKLKTILCSKIILVSLDPELETKLLVDSSLKFGIAYILIQVDKEGNIWVIRCGSCSVKKSWRFFQL